MRVFDPKYPKFTPYQKLNFVGAVQRYFEFINQDNKESTNDTYIDFYNNNIFPYVNYGKPAESFDIDYVDDLIKKIQEKNEYRDSTIYSTIRHLMYDPCKCFFNEFYPENNPFEINPADFRRGGDGSESQESAILSIVKSLTVEEEKKAFQILLADPGTDKGEYLGLAVMFFTACRNNEACGLNYGDILEMINYPNCFYIQITKSVEYRTNTLKSGGKTQNAFRRLPLVSIFKEYLDERIDFLTSKIQFPLEENGNVYQTVYDFPIVCRGNKYGTRCNSDDLTIAGRRFLRDEVGIKKSRIAGIMVSISEDKDTEYDLGEKDVTTYLLRRNMATHLYTLGLTVLESQYFMGHKMEGTALKRSDFGDETFLYEIWKKVQKHPLNQEQNHSYTCDKNLILKNQSNIKLSIDSKGTGDYFIQIDAKEMEDPIKVDFIGNFIETDVLEKQEEIKNEEVNIISLINKAYRKED